MDYHISKTSGASVLIEERMIDESTNIQLLGMYVPNYGLSIAQSLVRLLENFCDEHNPNSELSLLTGKPVIGQIYYDSKDDDITFYNGKEYKKIAKDKSIIQKNIEQVSTQKIYEDWAFFIGDDIYTNIENVTPDRQSYIDSWIYEPSSDKIIANNGIQFSGFLTPDKSSKYEFEVTVSSNDIDDDDNGAVIAYDDETGDSLSLVVSNNIPTNMPLLSIWYNYNQQNALLIDSKNHDEQFPFGESWNGKEMRLRVSRDTNTITVMASKWDDVANLDQTSSMTIKINEINEITSLAKPSRFGFFSNSQPLSNFSDFFITGSYTSNGGEIEYVRRFSTERKIELSGDMSSYDFFDGTGDVNLVTNVIRSDEAEFFTSPFNINMTGPISESILIDGDDITVPVSYRPLQIDGEPTPYRLVVDITGDGNTEIVFKNDDDSENSHNLNHEHSIDEVENLINILSQKLNIDNVSLQLNTISSSFNCYIDIPYEQSYSGPDRVVNICNMYVDPHDEIKSLVIPSMNYNVEGILSSGEMRLEVKSGSVVLVSKEINHSDFLVQGVYYYHSSRTPSISISLSPSNTRRKLTLSLVLSASDIGININNQNNILHLVSQSNVISNNPLNNQVDNKPEYEIRIVNVNQTNIIGKTLRDLYNEQYGDDIGVNYDIRFIITSSTSYIASNDRTPTIDTGEFPLLNLPIMISNQTTLYSKAGKGGSFTDNGATLIIIHGEDAGDVINLRTNVRLQNIGRIIAGGGGGAPIMAGRLDENYHNVALTGGGGAGYGSEVGTGLTNTFENYVIDQGSQSDERDYEFEIERYTLTAPTAGNKTKAGEKGKFFGEHREEGYLGAFKFTVNVESGRGGDLGKDGNQSKVIENDGTLKIGKAGKGGKAINTNGYNIVNIYQGEIIGKVE